MKNIIALLAAAFAAFASVNTAEAQSCGNRIYVTGRTSCGCPIYAERYVAYYDRCGNPVYQVRYVPVNHRCRPAAPPCRPAIRPIVRRVPVHPVPYRPSHGWGRGVGHGGCR
ncbi:MAG: hypothetical protein MUF31_11045 [Akkermansiaceae bacterium]|jgi:hypothetical protein|nr:hypothetical protein [Akkermansiaceae bacterium]